MRQPFLQLLITPMQVLLTLLTNEPPSTDAVLRCSISFSELLHIFRVCFVHLNGMSELQIGCIAPQILAFACVCVCVCVSLCVCVGVCLFPLQVLVTCRFAIALAFHAYVNISGKRLHHAVQSICT